MLNLSNAIQNIVVFNLRDTKINDSMIINTELSFSEFFQETLTDTEVKHFQEQFPNLEISNERIAARLYGNFLFINRGGYFSCFFNNSEHNPQWKNESEWTFSTNHDTCWRENFFSDFSKKIRNIRSSISDLSKIKKIQDISIPKHVIPNYSDISNTDIYNFKNTDTDESYNNNLHILKISKEATTFTKKNNL